MSSNNIVVGVSEKTHKKAMDYLVRIRVLEELLSSEWHKLRGVLRDSGEGDLYTLLFIHNEFEYDHKNKTVIITKTASDYEG